MDGCYEGFRMGVGFDLIFILYRLKDTLVDNLYFTYWVCRWHVFGDVFSEVLETFINTCFAQNWALCAAFRIGHPERRFWDGIIPRKRSAWYPLQLCKLEEYWIGWKRREQGLYIDYPSRLIPLYGTVSEMNTRDVPILKLCKKSRRYEGERVRED